MKVSGEPGRRRVFTGSPEELDAELVRLIATGSVAVDAADGCTYYRVESHGWGFFLDVDDLTWHWEQNVGDVGEGPHSTFNAAVADAWDYMVDMAWWDDDAGESCRPDGGDLW